MRYIVLAVFLQLVACGGATATSGPAYATAPGAQARSGRAIARGGDPNIPVTTSVPTPSSAGGGGH